MECDRKIQCWNYHNCGHGKDSLCPAVDQKAGRSCWLVSKTLCGGKVHGTHTERIKSCEGCGFYIYLHLSMQTMEKPVLSAERQTRVLRSNLPRC
ncbi:MAG: two-CW domain-containing protein [Thermodesulfovibrionales bacterium]